MFDRTLLRNFGEVDLATAERLMRKVQPGEVAGDTAALRELLSHARGWAGFNFISGFASIAAGKTGLLDAIDKATTRRLPFGTAW